MKAVGLFSGGLDSALAIKLVQDQGIEVVALNFVSPFCTCTGKSCSIAQLAEKLGVPIKIMKKGMDYLRIVRKPKFGYGKNTNPCIDCKIYIFKRAKKYAKEIGAKFLFTGEVLGQRPMSQHYKTLLLIEKEAGLAGKLVRPLCAGLMPPTEAEKKGWINREKLLKFEGRTRTPQIDLAKKFKIDGFMCGGSGCRLTDGQYSQRLRDLFAHKKRISMDDVLLLNVGRHFRLNDSKIVVGRNKLENDTITALKKKSDIIMQAEGIVGPTTLIINSNKESIELAAKLTARYSDAEGLDVKIKYGDKIITVSKAIDSEIEKYRLN